MLATSRPATNGLASREYAIRIGGSFVIDVPRRVPVRNGRPDPNPAIGCPATWVSRVRASQDRGPSAALAVGANARAERQLPPSISTNFADLWMLDPTRMGKTGKIPALTWKTPERLDQLRVIATPRGVLFVRRDERSQLENLFVPFVFSPTRFRWMACVLSLPRLREGRQGIVWCQ
jgi:hypothetical protein